MRLAAYEDAIYQRDAAGTLTVHRAFPLFMFGLAEEVDELTVLGRLDPTVGRSHYVVGSGADFAPLPHYENAAQVGAVLRALGGTARQFWRVLGHVDAVWVNGPSPMAVLLAGLALVRRRRLVLGVRQDTLAYARNRFPGRRAPQLAFRLMEAVWRGLARLAPVSAVGPDLAERYAGARRLHELSVSFVTDADLEAPRTARGEPPYTLLSVGRLETEKNPLLLADVLAELGEGHRLEIVGEGPLEPDLRARLDELGVAERAELAGYVPLDGGLLDRYRDADLFLHISWTEGLPQVLLEAFAARTPVVATDVGGVGAVASGAALLVPPGDARAAADAVRRLLGDAGLREQLVAAGLQRARERTAEAERRRLAAFIAG
jgi:glycosyltransferase involved in cell wall biosynthesis